VPIARGRRGAVVAPHHLATAAGLAILRAGGHAVDAAIATNAVLGVVMPSACGIGGDAFWLIWDAAERHQHALNGSGRAPKGMDAAALRARGLRSIPARSALAITIPGAVRSWGDAHARFGRLTREQVLAPAVELARGGFPAWDGLIDAIERTAPLVEAGLGRDAGFVEVFRPHGRAWRPGELVRFPALATTLERLAADGFDAFYEGDLGARQAAMLQALGLACAPSDFAEQTSTWGEPIATTRRRGRAPGARRTGACRGRPRRSCRSHRPRVARASRRGRGAGPARRAARPARAAGTRDEIPSRRRGTPPRGEPSARSSR